MITSSLVGLLILMCATTPKSKVGPKPCDPVSLGRDAAALVRPILKARIGSRPRVDSEGRSTVVPGSGEKLITGLYELMDNKSPAADEALAVMLRYYVGSDPGEDLGCEIIHRGQRMLPYLMRYEHCIPKTGAEPIPPTLLIDGDQYVELIEVIKRGERCERD